MAKNKKNKKIKTKKERKFSWKAMQKTIEGYGFKYSFSDFVKVTFLFIAIMIIVGNFLKLKPYFLGIFIVAVCIMLPFMIVSQFKYIYEQNRFNELTVYMESMAYSFKKKPKILTSLQDTAELTSGRLNSLVNKAIYMIENDYSDTIFRDALRVIEKEYECSRIIQLHRFLCKVEEQGGEYMNSMDILIDDIASWTQRTFLFQKERADIKRKIMISLIISLCICSTTLFMIPANLNVTDNPVYQIVTTVTLILFVCVYVFTQTKLNGSWLENDAIKNEAQIRRDYAIAHSKITADVLKKNKIKVALLSPLLIISVLLKSVPAIAASLLLMFIVYQGPKNKLKFAIRRTTREIEKEVPGWCRDIALNLQTENVYNAIANTLNNDCPIVLEAAVEQLIREIDENPSTPVPYNNFLAEFNIPEVNRMMKTLYSLSEFGVQDAEAQINKIIIQNNAMLEKAEIIKNEDSTAGVKFITLVPMFLGSCKMMVDLFLLCMAFMQATQLPM